MKFVSSICAVIGVELFAATLAIAQAPQVAAVFPAGGMRGTRTDVKIEGSALVGLRDVFVSGTGIKAKISKVEADGNSATISLDIASDASPGPYELRVISPRGISGPSYLWAGITPEINEVEPNDQLLKAMKLPQTPITVNGRVHASEDVDWYEFTAAAGETFVIDIVANRIFSPMDAALELRDASGHIIAEASEGYDRDPKIVYTSTKGGIYRLQVRDTLYRGSRNYVYRLTIGKLPIIASLVRSIAKRGEPLSSSVEGFNLGSTRTVSLDAKMVDGKGDVAWKYFQTSEGTALAERVALVDGSIVDTTTPGASSVLSS